MAKILLIDDQLEEAHTIRDALNNDGHAIEIPANVNAGLQTLCTGSFDLVIAKCGRLDLNLQKTFQQAIESNSDLMVMTISEDPEDELAVLDAGADDCMVTPIDTRKLVARVRALLRRANPPGKGCYLFDEFCFNVDTPRLTRGEREIRLRPKEYELLELFVRNPDKYFNVNAILDRLWDRGSEATVRTHIKSLRKKLNREGEPSIIVTAPRLGYRIQVAVTLKQMDNSDDVSTDRTS